MVKSHTLGLRTMASFRETGNARLASHLNPSATWSSHSKGNNSTSDEARRMSLLPASGSNGKWVKSG